MPVDPKDLGPLAALVGTWEGNDGLDVSHHHEDKAAGDTGYLEKASFSPFGPVDNGRQSLFGLDYRMAAWRHGEEADDPFHTEVGYWLWDAADKQVMRCFMVPRGVVVIAGATAEANARKFTLEAGESEPCYGILQNKYLLGASKSMHYECAIEVGDDTWSYTQDVLLDMGEYDEPYHHTDRNQLRRVD